MIKELQDLMNLPHGWDSYKGKPVSERNAARASQIIDEFCRPLVPLPMIVPTASGGVQLEWHAGDTDIEIYIGVYIGGEEVTFYAETLDELFEGPLAGNEGILKAYLDKVTAHRLRELPDWLDKVTT